MVMLECLQWTLMIPMQITLQNRGQILIRTGSLIPVRFVFHHLTHLWQCDREIKIHKMCDEFLKTPLCNELLFIPLRASSWNYANEFCLFKIYSGKNNVRSFTFIVMYLFNLVNSVQNIINAHPERLDVANFAVRTVFYGINVLVRRAFASLWDYFVPSNINSYLTLWVVTFRSLSINNHIITFLGELK